MRRKYGRTRRTPGLVISAVITASLFTGSDAAPVVQVCVWPGSTGAGGCEPRPPVELVAGESVQFYAAELRSDRTTSCVVPSGADPAGCDSAISLLDFGLATPQDTTQRFVRVNWPPLTTDPNWSSLEYHVLMQNVSNGQNLFDEIVLHPANLYDWVSTGAGHPFADTAYSVRVYAVAVEGANRLPGPPSEATAFVYPTPLYGPGQVGKPAVDTVNVTPPPP